LAVVSGNSWLSSLPIVASGTWLVMASEAKTVPQGVQADIRNTALLPEGWPPVGQGQGTGPLAVGKNPGAILVAGDAVQDAFNLRIQILCCNAGIDGRIHCISCGLKD
jgi:hypothetical protein